MTLLADLAAGGVEGLLKGVGSLARDIRTAITGEEPLTAEQRLAILTKTQELEQAVLNAETAITTGQLEINKVEAASDSLWKGGWRPLCGWVAGSALAYTYIIRPLGWWILQCVLLILNKNTQVPPMPGLDMTELMTLLLGMLGLGGLRSWDKYKGIK